MGLFDINDYVKKQNKAVTKRLKSDRKAITKRIKADDKAIKKAMKLQILKDIRAEKRIPIPAKRKKEVREKYKNRCDVCGRTNPLEIHHKNMNPRNNALSNLRLLCPTHHTLEHQKKYKKYKKK